MSDQIGDGSTVVTLSQQAFPSNAQAVEFSGGQALSRVPQTRQAAEQYVDRVAARSGRTASILWENAVVAEPAGARFPPSHPANMTFTVPQLQPGTLVSMLIGTREARGSAQ